MLPVGDSHALLNILNQFLCVGQWHSTALFLPGTPEPSPPYCPGGNCGDVMESLQLLLVVWCLEALPPTSSEGRGRALSN